MGNCYGTAEKRAPSECLSKPEDKQLAPNEGTINGTRNSGTGPSLCEKTRAASAQAFNEPESTPRSNLQNNESSAGTEEYCSAAAERCPNALLGRLEAIENGQRVFERRFQCLIDQITMLKSTIESQQQREQSVPFYFKFSSSITVYEFTVQYMLIVVTR